MWEYMSRRARECAEYILQTGATVRECANHLGISKSTVHKDVTERLYEVDKELYARVRKVLDKNLSERHIRGGIATRNKYLRRAGRGNECAEGKNKCAGRGNECAEGKNKCAGCGNDCAVNGGCMCGSCGKEVCDCGAAEECACAEH